MYIFFTLCVLMWLIIGIKANSALIIIISLVIIFITWFKYYKQKSEAQNEKEQSRVNELRRLELVKHQFKELQIEFIQDNNKISGFFHLFDALLFCKSRGYGYIEHSFFYDNKKISAFLLLSRDIQLPHEVDIIYNYINKVLLINRAESIFSLLPASSSALAEDVKLHKAKEEKKIIIKNNILKNIQTRVKADMGLNSVCVYIIASGKISKIGIAKDPNIRIKQLQTGNHKKLVLKKCWWFFSQEDAKKVEKEAHTLLKVKGFHAHGEWFNIVAEEAMSFTLEVINNLIDQKNIDENLLDIDNKFQSTIDNELTILNQVQWQLSKKIMNIV